MTPETILATRVTELAQTRYVVCYNESRQIEFRDCDGKTLHCFDTWQDASDHIHAELDSEYIDKEYDRYLERLSDEYDEQEFLESYDTDDDSERDN